MNTTKQLLNKYAPQIFLGASILGYGSTILLTASIASKLERRKAQLQQLEKKDRYLVYINAYGPVLALSVLTIGSMIGGHKVHMARTATAVAMYNIVRTTLSDYQDHVRTTLGPKKSAIFEADVSEKRMLRAQLPKDIQGTGSVLCYDGLSGRFFYSEMEAIRSAVNSFNKAMIDGDNMKTLNDLYFDFGMQPIDLGNGMGWEVGGELVDIRFDSKIAPNGKPCLIVRHENLPKLLW